jgi:hypothetical protein
MSYEILYVISILLSYQGGAEFEYKTLETYDSLEVCEIAMEETDKALEAKIGTNDGRGVITGYTITCDPK